MCCILSYGIVSNGENSLMYRIVSITSSFLSQCPVTFMCPVYAKSYHKKKWLFWVAAYLYIHKGVGWNRLYGLSVTY